MKEKKRKEKKRKGKKRKMKRKITCLAVNENNHQTVAKTGLTHTSVVLLTEEPVVS